MISIAIDGPSGAGKSSIARKVAAEINFIYVDTGALYRAVGLYAVRNNIPTTDHEQVGKMLAEIRLELKYQNGEQRVFLNGSDVSEDIRLPEMSMAASNVSSIPVVRDFLFEQQKKMAQENNVIMDGRDIGTVVLPQAQIKIFLTATPEDRAMRRCKQLELAGTPVDYEQLLKEIIQRDYNDSHREIAPLKQAEDAILVDTTGNTFEESVAFLEKLIKEKLAALSA